MSSLHERLCMACDAVGIEVPTAYKAGVWARSPVIGKAKTNRSGRVMIFDDYRGGVAFNWATGAQEKFFVDGQAQSKPVDIDRRRKAAEERRKREEAIALEAAAIAAEIVRTAEPSKHPYLEAKGFSDKLGLVHEKPSQCLPDSWLGRAMAKAMPQTIHPVLVVPGRINREVSTVQLITIDGDKQNLLKGRMGGAAHRISTGRETWICEGYATALSVYAALALLGRSATVLSAFSAQNVAKVAQALPGAVIAADHDKPVEQFDGLGTGEHWARKTSCQWVMPPMRGDFNDMHKAEGLRAVALKLREVCP